MDNKNFTRYSWKPESEFKFTGEEFSVLFNNTNNFLNGIITPRSILKVADALAILQNKLDEAIENKVAIPVEEPSEEIK